MGELHQFRRLPEDPGEPTAPCVRCGAPVDRAAIRCRRCGQSTLPGRPDPRGLPWWIWLVVLLGIAVVLGLFANR